MSAERNGLRIRLLGAVHAERDGEEITLGSAQRQAVFAALATNPDRALSREKLVGAVWGDDPPASALGSIYTYVSTLRGVLEPSRDKWAAGSVLTSGNGSYCLHVDEQAVDVFRFEALREESRRIRATRDPAAELAVVREALDLWHGEALTGVPGPYAQRQRLRLAELHLSTVERHAELMLVLGRATEVQAELTELVARHPRREQLTVLAMTAAARCGRLAEATLLYQRLRDRLIDETGTEPGSALRQAYAQLVADPPERVPPEPKVAGFIGRADEVRLIRQAVAEAAAGRGGSIWIDGGPGSGKSALLDEGLREARRLGCRVGWGVADELAQWIPMSVLFECFDATSGPLEIGDTARGPSGTWRTATEIVTNSTNAAIESVQALIVETCADGPLVLVIDDLQWADETSLLVWHALHRLIEHLPLLLVCACRPLPTRRELHLLRSGLPASGTRHIEVPQLSTQESRLLLERLGPIASERAAELVTEAAGNPLYLTLLAATPVDQLSPGLVAAITEHLAILSDETRRVLQAIAFLGDDCEVTDLSAVTGNAVPALIRAVESALDSGLLVENGPRFELRHPIVRRVLHDATPTALRVMVHREFAARIAAADGRLDRVGGQLIAGPVPIDAWVERWLTEHAEQIAVYLPDRAVATFRSATARPGLDPRVREVLTAQLARLLFQHGDSAEGEAGWVAARTTDPGLRAEMRWIIAVGHHRRGEDSAALAVVRQSLHDEGLPQLWSHRYRALLTHLNPTVGAMSRLRPAPPTRDKISVIH